MKLLIYDIVSRIKCKLRGNAVTQSVIRDRLALALIKSIKDKSFGGLFFGLGGDRTTNFLRYDTMYTIYISDVIYSQLDLQAITEATIMEFEKILKTKVSPAKYPNYYTSHSPYWQFVFQSLPNGSKIGKLNLIVDDHNIVVESKTYPEGRDEKTKTDDNTIVSIRSIRSSEPIGLDKRKFINVTEISLGEFVAPLDLSENSAKPSSNANTYLTLTVNNENFIVHGKKTKFYQMASTELYIAGKNAKEEINGIPVLHIADTHISNPQLHIKYDSGNIYVDAYGDVKFLGKKIGKTVEKIPKGSSILINGTIQLIIQ